MSHDIDDSTGQPAMAYVGEEPWHGLGEKLPAGQSIDVWKQAARLAAAISGGSKNALYERALALKG